MKRIGLGIAVAGVVLGALALASTEGSPVTSVTQEGGSTPKLDASDDRSGEASAAATTKQATFKARPVDPAIERPYPAEAQLEAEFREVEADFRRVGAQDAADRVAKASAETVEITRRAEQQVRANAKLRN